MGGVDNATEDAPRMALNNDKSCFGLDLPRAEGRPGLRLAFTISMGEHRRLQLVGIIQTPTSKRRNALGHTGLCECEQPKKSSRNLL